MEISSGFVRIVGALQNLFGIYSLNIVNPAWPFLAGLLIGTAVAVLMEFFFHGRK